MVLGKAYPALLGNLAGGGFSTRIFKPVFLFHLKNLSDRTWQDSIFLCGEGDLVFKSFSLSGQEIGCDITYNAICDKN